MFLKRIRCSVSVSGRHVALYVCGCVCACVCVCSHVYLCCVCQRRTTNCIPARYNCELAKHIHKGIESPRKSPGLVKGSSPRPRNLNEFNRGERPCGKINIFVREIDRKCWWSFFFKGLFRIAVKVYDKFFLSVVSFHYRWLGKIVKIFLERSSFFLAPLHSKLVIHVVGYFISKRNQQKWTYPIAFMNYYLVHVKSEITFNNLLPLNYGNLIRN